MPMPHNPLVEDLLALADVLVALSGRGSFLQAALRRSVSTSYYALFHALCTLCSDSLVRWSRTDLVDRTYRSLDHGTARRRLAALASTSSSGSSIKRVSTLFSLMQDQRNDADYERPRVLLSRNEAVLSIRNAREAIELLTAMDDDARRRLAVELLVAKAR